MLASLPLMVRVEDRVADGGHPVPEAKIRERYSRLWPLAAEAMALVDGAVVYDNSRPETPFAVVARYRAGRLVTAADWPARAPRELQDAGTELP